MTRKAGQKMRSLSTFNRLSTGTSALLRGICTAFRLETAVANAEARATAVAKFESYTDDRLYKRLSSLGAKKGLVAETINGYIREGRIPRKMDLDNCVKELRKFRRYHQALEVSGFPRSICVSVSP